MSRRVLGCERRWDCFCGKPCLHAVGKVFKCLKMFCGSNETIKETNERGGQGQVVVGSERTWGDTISAVTCASPIVSCKGASITDMQRGSRWAGSFL